MQQSQQEEQSWLKLLLLLAFIAFLGVLTVLNENTGLDLNFENPLTVLVLKLLQGFSSLLFFVLPALLMAYLWTKAKFSYLGILNKPKWLSLFLAATGMMLALPLINWLALLNQQMHLPLAFSGIERWMQESEAKAELLTKAFTAGSSYGVLALNLLVIAVIAALSEELFFRGLLQKIMTECFGNPHIAIWAAAFVFSAFHMQFYGFLPRMLMGAYLGYLFYWTGSLWVSVAAHFVNNALAVWVIWLYNRRVINIDIDKMGTNETEWFAVLVSVVMVISSLVLIYKKREVKN